MTDISRRQFTARLAFAGGMALIGRNMLRRLDTINRTSGEIIAGDLSQPGGLPGAVRRGH